MENVFKEGELHRRLWLPASLPYLSGQPPLTKSLVFSDWQMVPEAIAALTSHEAERRLRHERGIKGPAKKKEARLLRLSSAAEDLGSSMRVMLLLYPSDFLARAVDPLEIWRQNSSLSAETCSPKPRCELHPPSPTKCCPPHVVQPHGN